MQNCDLDIGIIGSSGRNLEDSEMISKEIYSRAVDLMVAFLINYPKKSERKLASIVSGGSSFCDHIAISSRFALMELKRSGKIDFELPKLKLYFPCFFDMVRGEFCETIVKNGIKNKGRSAILLNKLHRDFSAKVGIDSLKDLAFMVGYGAEIGYNSSFYGRNKKIAENCNTLFSLTFGDSSMVSGGTKFTIDYFSKNKPFGKIFHYNLSKLTK